MKAIINATVISRGQALKDHALIFDERIRAVCPTTTMQNWPVDEIVDAAGLFITPGLIDIHVHGCGGYDTMDATPEALEAMSVCLAKHGVTSFLPTTMSAEWDQIDRATAVVRRTTACRTGAQVLGVNLEGPFLNSRFKGAHAAEWLKLPDFELIADYIDVIRIITLAPELPGSAALLSKLATYPHVVPAIGHSGASFEEVQQAMGQGVRHATHLFNAMSPMHHRQPGVVGAVLASGLSAELIADNLHVHPGLYQLLLKTHGLERLILVSDSMRAASLGDGKYDLGGQMVQVKGGAARIPDGTLAGSVLTLNKAVSNFQQATGCQLAEAVALATRNPARLLGLENHIGDLVEGMQADIVVLDEECNARLTFVGGKAVHLEEEIPCRITTFT